MKVRWTDQAFQRLAEIEAFIARDDPKAGERLVDLLIARGEALADHPHPGRRLPEFPNNELREVIVGNYRLVYRVRHEDVVVLTRNPEIRP
ncbi:MAG: type II toxin-antitoxin system RelE/ParE family toxin [Chromatiaceae bacterium]